MNIQQKIAVTMWYVVTMQRRVNYKSSELLFFNSVAESLEF